MENEKEIEGFYVMRYKNCCFCKNELLKLRYEAYYCNNCVNLKLITRFSVDKFWVRLSNLEGNFYLIFNFSGGWSIRDYDWFMLCKGREKLNLKKAVKKLEQYEKLKGFM